MKTLSQILKNGTAVSARDEYGDFYVLEGNRVNVYQSAGYSEVEEEVLYQNVKTHLDPSFDCNKATLLEAVAYVNRYKGDD